MQQVGLYSAWADPCLDSTLFGFGAAPGKLRESSLLYYLWVEPGGHGGTYTTLGCYCHFREVWDREAPC